MDAPHPAEFGAAPEPLGAPSEARHLLREWKPKQSPWERFDHASVG